MSLQNKLTFADIFTAFAKICQKAATRALLAQHIQMWHYYKNSTTPLVVQANRGCRICCQEEGVAVVFWNLPERKIQAKKSVLPYRNNCVKFNSPNSNCSSFTLCHMENCFKDCCRMQFVTGIQHQVIILLEDPTLRFERGRCQKEELWREYDKNCSIRYINVNKETYCLSP